MIVQLVTWALVLFTFSHQQEVLSFSLIGNRITKTNTVPFQHLPCSERQLHLALHAKGKGRKRESYTTPIDGNVVMHMINFMYNRITTVIPGIIMYVIRFVRISIRLLVEWLAEILPRKLEFGRDKYNNRSRRSNDKGSRAEKVLRRIHLEEKEEKKQAVGRRIDELQQLTTQEVKDINKPYYALNDLNWNEYYRITNEADGSWEAKNKRALAAAGASEENARIEAKKLAEANKEKWRLEDEQRLKQKAQEQQQEKENELIQTALELATSSTSSEKIDVEGKIVTNTTNDSINEKQAVLTNRNDKGTPNYYLNFDLKAWMDSVVDKVGSTDLEIDSDKKDIKNYTNTSTDVNFNSDANRNVMSVSSDSRTDHDREKGDTGNGAINTLKNLDEALTPNNVATTRKPAIVEELTPGRRLDILNEVDKRLK